MCWNSKSESMEQPPRRKIRINDRDPYVYQRARAEAARFKVQRDKERAEKQAEWDRIPCDPNAARRRQSSIIGLMFAALAFFIWSGTRLAAPRITVVAYGGQGVVLVDSLEVGRTGETIKVTHGIHTVTIRFDSSRFVPEPYEMTIQSGFSIKPKKLEFQATLPMNLYRPERPKQSGN